MTELNQEASNRKIFDIDTATKLIAFFTILFYIVGFLTTNLYLQQLGFSDFSLLKPRFILTGSLVVASIVLNLLLISSGYLLISRNSIKALFKGKNGFFNKIGEIFNALLLLVIPLGLCFVFVVKSNAGKLDISELLIGLLWLYGINLTLGLISLIPLLSIFAQEKKIFLLKQKGRSLRLQDKYMNFGILFILYIAFPSLLRYSNSSE